MKIAPVQVGPTWEIPLIRKTANQNARMMIKFQSLPNWNQDKAILWTKSAVEEKKIFLRKEKSEAYDSKKCKLIHKNIHCLKYIDCKSAVMWVTPILEEVFVLSHIKRYFIQSDYTLYPFTLKSFLGS